MKRNRYGALALLLALCMMLSLSVSASAFTLQEQYYLDRLAPKTLPRSGTSYPAKLIVDLSHMILTAHVEFQGTCGTSAVPTDEDLLAFLRQAVSGVSDYKSLQDAADDKVVVETMTEKLKFSDEDTRRILENLGKFLGLNKLLPELSRPDWSDPEGILLGIAKDMGKDVFKAGMADTKTLWEAFNSAALGSMEVKPKWKPSLNTPAEMVVSGLQISWEEFQRDQQKYRDIISLSLAKGRLRDFYSAFNQKYRAFLVERGEWVIEINAQDVADLTYNQMPGSKQLWTADIDLKKSDGGFDSITGTYSGTFKLCMDADMLAFDDGYADFHAEYISRAGGTQWYATGNEGKTSEIKLAYEIPNCQLSIALPPGVNRHFFEESIPSSSLAQTEFTIDIDRTISVRSDMPDGYGYEIVHVIENDGVYAYNQTVGWVSRLGSGETNNNDGDNMPWPPDTRGGVTMTLVIDMLSN